MRWSLHLPMSLAGQEVDDGPKEEDDDDHGTSMVNSNDGLSNERIMLKALADKGAGMEETEASKQSNESETLDSKTIEV